MPRKYIILAILALAAILFVILALKWVYKPAKSTVASEKAVAEVTASTLISAFSTDEQDANTTYLGKVIIVNGPIYGITEDSTTVSVTLKGPEDIAGVICSFNKKNIDRSDLTNGQQLKAKGKCDGYLLDVVLTKCSLVK
jgi:type II secretory pathway pseudopilin PulG